MITLSQIASYTILCKHFAGIGSSEMDILFSTNSFLLPLCTAVMLADFHNVGMIPDLNDLLNKSANVVDSSSEQSRKILGGRRSGPGALL